MEKAREAHDPDGDRSIPIRSIERWSAQHRWQERARAWDDWLQRERDRVARTEAARWERRRLRALEAVYQDAQTLRERLRRMLAFPLSRQRVEDQDGRTITIVEPARWSYRELIAGFKVIAELEALVLNAATRDPELMTDAELAGVLDAIDLPEPPADAA